MKLSTLFHGAARHWAASLYRAAALCPAAALVAVLSTPAVAQVPIAGQFVVGGLSQPLFLTHAPGDTSRLFVVEKQGRIKIVQGSTVLPTAFLDIASIVNSGTLEFGLLGMCFDPDYATNGFFYVNYSEQTTGNSIIARYTVSANPNVADPASRFQVLLLVQPNGNHRGGWLDFGPDGYLYASLGDGGGQGDPSNRAQNLALLQGKILRLDVSGGDDFPADANKNYRIPPTNPFVGQAGVAPEIWVYGLRNPWRCSFDRQTFDLYIGDVGQGSREEVSFIPAGTSGQNFGWRCTEGTSCTSLTGCTCNGPTLTPPIFEYTHSAGISITGGYVYRGNAIPALRGTYFYSDWSGAPIWTFRYDGVSVTEVLTRTADVAPPTGQTINSVVSFGEDADGELYIVDNGGEIFKIVPGIDAVAPQVTITSPTSAPLFDTTSPTLTLGGTASDAVGVTQVTWTSLAGGSGTATGTTNWSIPGLALAPGGNSFTVTARDAANNTRTDSILVRYFPQPTSFCAGDGTLVPCPCGNSGTSGRGCANSLFAAGALLTGGGTASLSDDSAALYASSLSGSLAIFVQGGTQQAPALLDDGIFCVGAPIVRLGNMPVGGNAAVYPDLGAPEISLRGMIATPGDYTYQVFYRNAAVSFCPPATSNRTNGVILHWVP